MHPLHSMQLFNHAHEVIQRIAELRELEESTKTKLIPTYLDFLGKMFDEVYTMLVPSREDYEARQTLIAFVEKFVNSNIQGNSFNNGGPSVRAFGSYTMNLFTSESDLDLSVNIGYTGEDFPRNEKIKVLKKLTKALRSAQGKGTIRGILPVLRATVPVLKFVDCRTRIECDISIENKDGILKSELLRIFSSIDWRFPQLCYLVKAWAKKHSINSSKDRTLNSLSLILLVALHLQMRSPPILPPFRDLLEGLCFGPDGHGLVEVERRVLRYKDFGKHNKECVAELFISFLCKLSSVQTLWEQGLCASTYEGTWISKMLGNKIGCINVEDFTIRSQNAARAVAKEECQTIYKCIRETLAHLQQPLRSLSEASALNKYLFGSELRNTSSHLPKEERKNLGKRSMPFGDRANSKATRISEEERRGRSCAREFPVLHSVVERTNFVPRNGVSFVGNAAYPLPSYVFPPTPGYRHPIEQAQRARYSQGQDLRPGPLQGLQSGVRYNQWQDLGYRPRYGQGHGPAHETSHWVPHEARYTNSYDNGSAHEASHVTLLDAKFVHQSNWSHNHQKRW